MMQSCLSSATVSGEMSLTLCIASCSATFSSIICPRQQAVADPDGDDGMHSQPPISVSATAGR